MSTPSADSAWTCPECGLSKDGHKIASLGDFKMLLCPNLPLGEVRVPTQIDRSVSPAPRPSEPTGKWPERTVG